MTYKFMSKDTKRQALTYYEESRKNSEFIIFMKYFEEDDTISLIGIDGNRGMPLIQGFGHRWPDKFDYVGLYECLFDTKH